MPSIIQDIQLDLSKLTPPVTVRTKQNDRHTRFLRVQFTDRGTEVLLPEGVTARLSVRKPDGKQVLNDGVISDNTVLYELTEQMLCRAGHAHAEAMLFRGEKLLSSAIFHLNIFPTAFDADRLESTDEYRSLENALTDVDRMTAHMDDTTAHLTAEEREWIESIPNMTPKQHTHAINEVTNLRQELDNRVTKQDLALNKEAFLSLRDYGAVGDGVADDTAAVQNALAAAIESGRILFLDRGVYRITDRIIIDSQVMIIGASDTESVIYFNGGEPAEETPYDPVNFEESHAALCIRCDNVTLWNFALKGGLNQNDISEWNGITFHYPRVKDVDGVQTICYGFSQRCNIQQLNISCFRNGFLIYGGWNRYILTCQCIDCSEAGLQYKALELSTIGNWSASGDIIQSCQFVRCGIGLKADRAFETTVQNCIFEYDTHAIWTYLCRGIYFINCWNEANYDKLYIAGSAKFSGGYNISPSTVEHVNLDGNSTVEFNSDTERIVKQGNNVVFYQTGGIITAGVSLGSQRINQIENPSFGTIAVPEFTDWTVEASYLTSIDVADTLNGVNSAVIDCAPSWGWESAPQYGILSSRLSINPTEDYTFSLFVKTDNMEQINQGVYVAFRLFQNDSPLAWVGFTNIAPIANDVWEDHAIKFNASEFGHSEATHVQVKIYVEHFGKVWISTPFFGAVSVTSDSVAFRLSEDDRFLEAINYTGGNIGQVVKKSYVDEKFDELKAMIQA